MSRGCDVIDLIIDERQYSAEDNELLIEVLSRVGN